MSALERNMACGHVVGYLGESGEHIHGARMIVHQIQIISSCEQCTFDHANVITAYIVYIHHRQPRKVPQDLSFSSNLACQKPL